MMHDSQNAKALERLVRLDTYPLAVKLLKSEKDIPEGSINVSGCYTMSATSGARNNGLCLPRR